MDYNKLDETLKEAFKEAYDKGLFDINNLADTFELVYYHTKNKKELKLEKPLTNKEDNVINIFDKQESFMERYLKNEERKKQDKKHHNANVIRIYELKKGRTK